MPRHATGLVVQCGTSHKRATTLKRLCSTLCYYGTTITQHSAGTVMTQLPKNPKVIMFITVPVC